MLRVIGAGLPRTGTSSLREALPQLLGGKCYHMASVFDTPGHAKVWADATQGHKPPWVGFLEGHTAAVDWPASVFWPQLAEEFPDAIILLSVRADGATWYRSMINTVLKARAERINALSEAGGAMAEAGKHFERMFNGLWRTIFGDIDPNDADACAAGYQAYVDKVRATAPADRLVVWEAKQGWEPICAKLGLPVPDEPFPHANSTAEFQERVQEHLDQAARNSN